MDIRFILFGCVLFTSGCASNHSGYLAKDQSQNKAGDKTLVVSAEQSTNLSSEYFGYVTITFENLTGNWLELSDMKVEFFDNGHEINISAIKGKKLAQWQRSISSRNAIRNHNESLALSGMLLLGTVAATRSDRSLSEKGLNTMVASAGVITAKSLGNDVEKINNSQSVPDSHLANDALIPPMLSTKKWIVFNSLKPNELNDLGKFRLTFRDQNNKKYKYSVKYRKRSFN